MGELQPLYSLWEDNRANTPEGYIEAHEDQEGNWENQHVFTKGKLCVTNHTVLYDEMTDALAEGRTVDIISFHFSKAFDTVCCS